MSSQRVHCPACHQEFVSLNFFNRHRNHAQSREQGTSWRAGHNSAQAARCGAVQRPVAGPYIPPQAQPQEAALPQAAEDPVEDPVQIAHTLFATTKTSPPGLLRLESLLADAALRAHVSNQFMDKVLRIVRENAQDAPHMEARKTMKRVIQSTMEHVRSAIQLKLLEASMHMCCDRAQEVLFFFLDVWKVAKLLLMRGDLSRHIVYSSETRIQDGEKRIGQMHTSRSWRRVEIRIGAGKYPVILLFSFDGTSGFNRKLTPIYMSLGNITSPRRFMSDCWVMVGIIPALEKAAGSYGGDRPDVQTAQNEEYARREQYLLHQCLDKLLEPVREPVLLNEGEPAVCVGGRSKAAELRHLVPWVGPMILDKEGVFQVSCMKLPYKCPACHCGKGQFSEKLVLGDRRRLRRTKEEHVASVRAGSLLGVAYNSWQLELHIGRTVRKQFGDNFHAGTIVSCFPSVGSSTGRPLGPHFRIHYQDGDAEDMSLDEVWAHYFVGEKMLLNGVEDEVLHYTALGRVYSLRDGGAVPYDEVAECIFSFHRGRAVQKLLTGGIFVGGTVETGYPGGPHFRVRYSNDDIEDMFLDEVQTQCLVGEEIKVQIDNVPKRGLVQRFNRQQRVFIVKIASEENSSDVFMLAYQDVEMFLSSCSWGDHIFTPRAGAGVAGGPPGEEGPEGGGGGGASAAGEGQGEARDEHTVARERLSPEGVLHSGSDAEQLSGEDGGEGRGFDQPAVHSEGLSYEQVRQVNIARNMSILNSLGITGNALGGRGRRSQGRGRGRGSQGQGRGRGGGQGWGGGLHQQPEGGGGGTGFKVLSC